MLDNKIIMFSYDFHVITYNDGSPLSFLDSSLLTKRSLIRHK